MRLRRAGLPALALLAAFALPVALVPVAAPAQQPAPAQPAAKVRVQPVELRLMAPEITVPGSVHSRQDAEVAAEVAGRVVWVAEAGTAVQAGDAIARLDDRVLALELRGLDSQILSLRAQLDFQDRELARLRQLAARDSAPVSRLEEAQSRRDVLAQDLVQAQVRRERVQLDLERTVVKAPFAGQIAGRMLEVGEYSSPGAKVARLVAVDNVEVRAQAPVSLAGALSEGQVVTLTVDQGVAAKGRISRIIPVGEERSRTFEIRIAPADTGQGWIVGGAVGVALPSAPAARVTAIHRDALVLRGEGMHVWRVTSENRAERITVRPGLSLGDWVAVEDAGLAPGDRLVVRGAERLRDNQDVDLDLSHLS